MDTDGNVLSRLCYESYGDQIGRFLSPHGIALDSKWDIYVAGVSWIDYGRHLDPPCELQSMQKLTKLPK